MDEKTILRAYNSGLRMTAVDWLKFLALAVLAKVR
jgi:hypothetical protein